MRQPFKHLFTILFTLEPENHFVKLCNKREFDLVCSTEMYHFEKLL